MRERKAIALLPPPSTPHHAEALGRCQRCGWVCDGSSRDRVLQVHHWDRMPENNTRSNLVALCPRCHLALHQGGRGNVSEGQMGLLGEV